MTINILNNVVKLVSLSWQTSGSMPRSHTEESIKICTCLVVISREVSQIFATSNVKVFLGYEAISVKKLDFS